MIEVAAKDGVWRVTLNRPDKANALNAAMLERLAEVAQLAHADPELRVFVLTGAGDRAFCAGADVGDGADMFAFTRDPCWSAASNAIAALPCLTIAALNGTVAGGGFCPALACDIRISTPGAKFFYPVLKRGFLPQPADVLRLQTLVGPSRAKLILMAGQKLDAAEAMSIGLVDAIVPLEDFEATIAKLTEDARAAKPASITAIKRLFDGPEGEKLEDCYRAAYDDDAAALTRISGRED